MRKLNEPEDPDDINLSKYIDDDSSNDQDEKNGKPNNYSHQEIGRQTPLKKRRSTKDSTNTDDIEEENQ
jgi:hypothetical protein